MKAFCAISLVFTVQLVCGQGRPGTVRFNNRNVAFGLDAPITFRETGTGVGPGYSAGLYYRGNLLPDSITPFREATPENPKLSAYMRGLTLLVPGTYPLQQHVGGFEMRVWPTSMGTYESTPEAWRGSSGMLVIAEMGGHTGPSNEDWLPPSFTGFQVSIPEPSPLALGAIGFGLSSLFSFLVKPTSARTLPVPAQTFAPPQKHPHLPAKEQ